MSPVQLSLKGRALRLLSGREHSRTELERKLARFEEEPGTLKRALDDLQAKGFISEQRVIESVLHRRAAKLGTARLKHELQGKGLDPQAVAQAMVQLKLSEHERALAVWQKKFGAAPASPLEAARQIRFLAARGFGAEAIRKIVKGPASA
ncbi:MAG: recombination regulator RecX [Comamonadaceae bacterium]